MSRLKNLTNAIEERAQAIRTSADLEPLTLALSDKKLVMIGEATHGTHEFYEMRAAITESLIEDYGFQFVAVEGDWPACQHINDYIAGHAADPFAGMRRWPTWMWANEEVLDFADRLKSYNAARKGRAQVGFFGLDVYSLFDSVSCVLEELRKIDKNLYEKARELYSCFARFQGDEKEYARSLLQFPQGCRDEAVEVLTGVLSYRIGSDALHDADYHFNAQQNARIVKNAEAYYSAMMKGNGDSWNVRDRHMMETLDILMGRYGDEAKGVVWAHNTHVGDYRATDMGEQGLVNIGGLARRHYGKDEVALVGFGTYTGKVVASHAWDGPIETLTVPPAKEGSWEAVFHEVAQKKIGDAFFLCFTEADKTTPLDDYIGHRAIGVVYEPRRELRRNYVPTALASRYDAFIYIDYTTPLQYIPQDFRREELPETWPAGF